MSVSSSGHPEVWNGILVENLPTQISHLTKILTSSHRINFLTAVQSAEAFKANHFGDLEKAHFLLTDLDLDGPNGDKRMNGIGLAEEIRRDPRFSRLPVIFYTSFPKVFAGTLNTLKFARDKHYGIMLREELTEERLLSWLPRLSRGAYLSTSSVENYLEEDSEAFTQSPLQVMKEFAFEGGVKVDLPMLEKICHLNGLGFTTEYIADEMKCSVRQLQRWFQDIFKLLGLEDPNVSPQDNRRRLAIMYAAKRWLYWDENNIPRTRDGKEYRELNEINQFRLIQSYNRDQE